MVLSEAKTYTLVYCHLEGLRSSLAPTLHLTQLAAATSATTTSFPTTFFRAIAPPGLGHYLDQCRVGGDLLQVLHMAREDRETFLFRPPVLVAQVERLVAVTEVEAIRAFLAFLQALPANAILVCMDEATVAELVEKVEAVDRAGLQVKVVGYTWWSRVLVYPSTPTKASTRVATRAAVTRRLDLEDWWSSTFPHSPLPTLRSAKVVARAMAEAVTEVARRAGTTPSSGRFVARIGLEMRVRPEGEGRRVVGGRELLVIVNSFKPDTVTSFTVDMMDTVNIDSDDEDLELEEKVEAVRGVKEEADNREETISISSDSEDSRLGSGSEDSRLGSDSEDSEDESPAGLMIWRQPGSWYDNLEGCSESQAEIGMRMEKIIEEEKEEEYEQGLLEQWYDYEDRKEFNSVMMEYREEEEPCWKGELSEEEDGELEEQLREQIRKEDLKKQIRKEEVHNYYREGEENAGGMELEWRKEEEAREQKEQEIREQFREDGVMVLVEGLAPRPWVAAPGSSSLLCPVCPPTATVPLASMLLHLRLVHPSTLLLPRPCSVCRQEVAAAHLEEHWRGHLARR